MTEEKKNVGGRPPKPEEERLSEVVKFRVTRLEKEVLRLASERTGLTLSNFIKKTVMDGASIIAGGGTPIEVIEFFTDSGEGFATYLKFEDLRKRSLDAASVSYSASPSPEPEEDSEDENENES